MSELGKTFQKKSDQKIKKTKKSMSKSRMRTKNICAKWKFGSNKKVVLE